MTQWERSTCPAYIEMSHQGGYVYPQTRTCYNLNWLNAKLVSGCNMKLTAMIKPSPLQQSMTWVENTAGDYMKETSLSPLLTPPEMGYDSHSDEEQDESITPPGSPSIILLGTKGSKLEDVSNFTHICDWPSVNIDQKITVTVDDIPIDYEEDARIEISHEFIDFNHISDSLDIEDILGDSAQNIQHSHINEPSERGLKSNLPYEFEELLPPTGDDGEKMISTFEDIRHVQADTQDHIDVGKPLSNVNSVEVTLVDITHGSAVTEGIIDTDAEDMSITVPGAKSWIGDEIIGLHEKALGLIGFVKAAQATMGANIETVVAAHIIVPGAEYQIDNGVAEYKQPQNDNDHRTYASEVSRTPIKTIISTSADPSPDLKYVHDPNNASLVWNTVAAGWFAILSVPWVRLAVAAAGTLFDIVSFAFGR
jgi:hypothetical protein